jgi:hypothetical protein
MKPFNFLKVLILASSTMLTIFGTQSCSKSVDAPPAEKAVININDKTENMHSDNKTGVGASVYQSNYTGYQVKMPNLKVSAAESQSYCGNIYYKVANIGGASSGAFYVTITNQSGVIVHSFYVAGLQANESRNYNFSTNVRYTSYWNIKADASNAVSEISEQDNAVTIRSTCIY